MTIGKPGGTIPLKLYRDQLVTIGDLQDFKEELLISLARLMQDRSDRPSKRWLKSHEVKSLLNISKGTLQAMRNHGTLPFTKIGNLIYYDQEDIDAVLADKKFQVIKGRLPPRKWG